jgi:excisionase family DNA binding protein
MTPEAGRGMTVRETARLLRVGPDRIRGLIRRGELGALNLGDGRRPRFVILPSHLQAFEQARRVTPPPKPVARRKRRPPGWIDYFAD